MSYFYLRVFRGYYGDLGGITGVIYGDLGGGAKKKFYGDLRNIFIYSLRILDPTCEFWIRHANFCIRFLFLTLLLIEPKLRGGIRLEGKLYLY